ncbi:hypothetical protein BL254_17430 [Protofrankia sp. BMG5.30]|uniref:Uncharacterized protein n=1 Tax=Protofrankia coriariae TaxID=1562887 RepID=A0ABR5EYR8_9ACTN|nr:hypothetical protein FrCorBMG51_24035 [Protofrankia coriariae]ONH34179.1 hypothetical protein BL254_17430 [Protofrankia sp. BMG5.30]
MLTGGVLYRSGDEALSWQFRLIPPAQLARPDDGRVRAAFYGRTNARGVNGIHMLARQFKACQETAEGQAVLTGFFYDLPEPVDEIMVLAFSGVGGPPRRDGGRDDLAASLGREDRDFDPIICSSLDRLLCKRDELHTWEILLDQYQVPVITADGALAW